MKKVYTNIAPHTEPTTVLGRSRWVKKTVKFLSASIAIASIGIGTSYSYGSSCTQGMIFGADAGYSSYILACAQSASAVTATILASTPGTTGISGSLPSIPANSCVNYTLSDITKATGVTLLNSGQRALLQINVGATPSAAPQASQVVFLLVGPGGSIAPMPTTDCLSV